MKECTMEREGEKKTGKRENETGERDGKEESQTKEIKRERERETVALDTYMFGCMIAALRYWDRKAR